MSDYSIKHKIEQLRMELNRHNHLYYVLDQPEISDFEFDSLMNNLIDLEKKYPVFFDPLSPTVRVGGGLISHFDTVKHSSPMLSLSNTYSKNELIDFDFRVKKILNTNSVNYTCELKYDGVAVSLIYDNGLLKRGVTRGDGMRGDDVTENIKTIKTIPLKLFGNFPNALELRGEIFISKNEFNKINRTRERKKHILEEEYRNQKDELLQLDSDKLEKKYLSELKRLDKYANPRNLASGSLKLLDSSKVAKRNLDCVIYSVHSDDLPFNTHYDNLLKTQEWGFKVSQDIKTHDNVDSIMNFIDSSELKRDMLPFEIDGIVIKVNNIFDQELLGHTAKSPRWAISYKFKSAKASTVLKNIIYQVGRTGAITPVAELEPVSLAGSMIRRASLHNEDFIKKLDLKIGDTVFIEKGGDVIPKVVSVDIAKRTLLCEDISFISKCPFCDSILHKLLNEANYYCLNTDNCMPQKIAQIEHFISRDAMNINTLGSKTVLLLFEEGIINNITDLYDLNVSELIHLKGFGEKSKSVKKAQNIITSLEESKNIPFDRVLYALGIRHVGKTVARKLVGYFNSIEDLINASNHQLLEVDEIGEKIANSLLTYFQKKENIEIVQKLQKHGLQFKGDVIALDSSKLDGLTFIVSGTFTISRSDIKNLIELNGGKNSTSLSQRTSYLIAGDSMGPKKKEKAASLGISVISEMEFRKMLE